MFRLAFRSLTANRRRYAAIMLATIGAVGFVSASLVLSDSMTSMFTDIIQEGNAGTDVAVRATESVGSGINATRAPLDVDLIDRISDAPGVAAATPLVFTVGRIIDSDGKPIGSAEVPAVLTNWIDDPALNGMTVVSGHAPTSDDEVVLDRDSLEASGLAIGDPVTVLTPEPRQFVIAGEAQMSNSAGSLGGATVVKAPLHTVQQAAFGRAGLATEIDVRARAGVSEDQLLASIKPLLPEGTEAITGSEQSDEIIAGLDEDFLSLLRTFLLAFAAVAMVTAGLTIATCFAIVATQRRGEMALVRSLGASRRQVLGSAMLEALGLGLIASAAGLGVGYWLARVLNGLIGRGLSVPAGAAQLSVQTAAIALGIGTAVTLAAAVLPLVRVSAVSPVAALRGSAAPPDTVSRRRIWIGGVIGVGAITVAVLGAMGERGSMGLTGVGALGLLVAAVLVAPAVIRPFCWLVARLTPGQNARIARSNLDRSPTRAASAGSALTVGVAVVTIMTVLAASLIRSVDVAVSNGLIADVVVVPEGGPISEAMVDAMAKRPELTDVSSYAATPADLFGGTELVGFTTAAASKVLDLDGPGTTPWPDRLDEGDVVVSTAAASRHDLKVGSPVTIGFLDGPRNFTVTAIHSSMQFLGDYAVSVDTPLPDGTPLTIEAITANAAGGVSPTEAVGAANEVIAPLYGPKARTRADFAGDVGKQINSALGIVYAMLGLSVLIALLGIGTSMSLSISERARELRLLHALGFTRGGLRSMVRWESAMVAALGTLVGVAVGLGIGGALMAAINRSMESGEIAIPAAPLVVIVVIGTLAGAVSSLRPSRRAARLAIALPR